MAVERTRVSPKRAIFTLLPVSMTVPLLFGIYLIDDGLLAGVGEDVKEVAIGTLLFLISMTTVVLAVIGRLQHASAKRILLVSSVLLALAILGAEAIRFSRKPDGFVFDPSSGTHVMVIYSYRDEAGIERYKPDAVPTSGMRSPHWWETGVRVSVIGGEGQDLEDRTIPKKHVPYAQGR
jgi:hypothetical protein